MKQPVKELFALQDAIKEAKTLLSLATTPEEVKQITKTIESLQEDKRTLLHNSMYAPSNEHG